MIKIRELILSTDDGFCISRHTLVERFVDTIFSPTEVDENVEMITESGNRVIAIAEVDKGYTRQEESNLRNDLRELIIKIKEIYVEELRNPIFPSRAFSEVGTLIKEYFQING